MTEDELKAILERFEKAHKSNKLSDAFWAADDIPVLLSEVERMQTCLRELIQLNRIRNDLDAYLLAVAEFGIYGRWGVDQEFTTSPQRKDFGVE
jgi:hypothetical protein